VLKKIAQVEQKKSLCVEPRGGSPLINYLHLPFAY
jgi:hypothetical protein